jgi:hypothetical protein
MIKRFVLVAMLVVSHAGLARAQTSFAGSAYFYVVPGGDNYLQPTVRADADRLHLEARYNYEGIHTVSLWGGYTFEGKGAVLLTFTPMFGIVAGDMSGVAPGGELTLEWKLLEFYSEGEYVHDLDDQANSFFYSWSELTASLPMKWRVGGALQRTQVYETPREFQGGVLVGTTLDRVDVTAYVFDLDLEDQTWVLAAAMEF